PTAGKVLGGQRGCVVRFAGESRAGGIGHRDKGLRRKTAGVLTDLTGVRKGFGTARLRALNKELSMSKVNLPPRVYLIDDDSIMLGLMQRLVQPLNVEAVCFSSAEAFLQAYQPGPCECVVSDMRM